MRVSPFLLCSSALFQQHSTCRLLLPLDLYNSQIVGNSTKANNQLYLVISTPSLFVISRNEVKKSFAQDRPREKSLPFQTELFPSWIYTIYQLILFFSSPFLNFFFSRNSGYYILGLFKINQFVYVVFFCKSFSQLVFVLVNSSSKIIGHSNVHHSIIPVCE